MLEVPVESFIHTADGTGHGNKTLTPFHVRSLFLLACALPAACVSTDRGVDFNPFFRTAVLERDGSRETDALIPVYYRYESTRGIEWGLRPLIICHERPKEERKDCQFLLILGRYVRDPNGTRFRVWPVFWYEKYAPAGRKDEEDVDWTLFPLLWGGHSASGENYFAVFPLAGRIRDFIAYDTFDFFLWPLYQRVTRKVDTKSVSTSILLFLAWTRGGSRDGSFRVLPFYMQRFCKGRWRKYSVLWPVFSYQENRLNTRTPSKLYGAWPLFIYEHSKRFYRFGALGPVAYMGPLIQLFSETPERYEGKPNREGKRYYRYDLPWPIIRIEKNRENSRFKILPLYSHFHQPELDSTAWLVPFIWFRHEHSKHYDRDDFFFVPFVHHMKKRYKPDWTRTAFGGENGSDLYWQAWPFCHRFRGADGSEEFSALSIVPLRTQRIVQDLDEAIWPFFNLYRYRREPWGVVRHTALLGLFQFYSDPWEERISIPLLYNGRFSSAEGWEHDFFLNLLSVGGNGEGLKKLCLLFIPLLGS